MFVYKVDNSKDTYQMMPRTKKIRIGRQKTAKRITDVLVGF
jgi:hypothetical protein